MQCPPSASTDRIAALTPGSGRVAQDLLGRAAANWRAGGHRVVGLLAEDRDGTDGGCSAGNLRDIASGRRYSIAQTDPPAGAHCHLDAGGFAAACADLLPQIPTADVVVLSKFGMLEARGEGLWPAFTLAVELDKPLLTTVSGHQLAAWRTFAPSAAWLPTDFDAVAQWWQTFQPTAAAQR